MKSLIFVIGLLLLSSLAIVNSQPQPFPYGPLAGPAGRRNAAMVAAANANSPYTPATVTSNLASGYQAMGLQLTPQQIATMLQQAQAMPLTQPLASGSGSSANVAGNVNGVSTNGVGMSPNTLYQVPQPGLQQSQQPFTSAAIMNQAGSNPYQQPIPQPATNINSAATAGTAPIQSSMTLDQLFQMYPQMRAQYASTSGNSFNGVSATQAAQTQPATTAVHAAAAAAAAGLQQQHQALQQQQALQQAQQQASQQGISNNNFASAQPYTSYAPYAAYSASSLPSNANLNQPIMNNQPQSSMAYIQNNGADFAGVSADPSQQGADGSDAPTTALNGNANNNGAANGCPSLSDNPQLVQQSGNSYALVFAPTTAGQPVNGLQSVQVSGDVSGKPLSSSMDMATAGVWQSLVNVNPGDTINWSYIFNAGNSQCQGQSYQAFIPVQPISTDPNALAASNAGSAATMTGTDVANGINANVGPSRSLLGVPQQQVQQQAQAQAQQGVPQTYAQQQAAALLAQQYQQQLATAQYYQQFPQQYQGYQPYQPQQYQVPQQIVQQQQPQAQAVVQGDNTAALRRPCPLNPVHTTKITPLAVNTGRPIENGATMYGVSFIGNADIAPLDYVDLHYSINSGEPWQQNIRMVRNASNPNQFDYSFGLPLKQNDELGIQFTYSSQYNDCDTPEQIFSPTAGVSYVSDDANAANGVDASSLPRTMMTTTSGAPTSIATTCPTISYTSDVPLLGQSADGSDMFGLNFVGQMGAPVDWVETHYRVNNQPQQNYRMLTSTPGMFEVQGITMNRGDQLLYSFTHSINGINCDTPVMTYINQGAAAITNYGINSASAAAAAIVNGNSRNSVIGVGQSPMGTPAAIVNTGCGRTQYVSGVSATPINRRNIKPGDQNLYDLMFRVMDGSPMAYVDAHYTITRSQANIQPWQTNDRMDAINVNGAANNGVSSSSDAFITPAIQVLPGDILGYSFTFQPANGDACDTATETFTVT